MSDAIVNFGEGEAAPPSTRIRSQPQRHEAGQRLAVQTVTQRTRTKAAIDCRAEGELDLCEVCGVPIAEVATTQVASRLQSAVYGRMAPDRNRPIAAAFF